MHGGVKIRVVSLVLCRIRTFRHMLNFGWELIQMESQN